MWCLYYHTAACHKDGVTYSDGETFMENLCTTCQCTRGQITRCVHNALRAPIPSGQSVDLPSVCIYIMWSLWHHYHVVGPCELIPQPAEILSLYNGVCNSAAPVILNECSEQWMKDNVVNCCIPLTDPRATDFVCINRPGFPVTLKYIDVTDCNCSPCGWNSLCTDSQIIHIIFLL